MKGSDWSSRRFLLFHVLILAICLVPVKLGLAGTSDHSAPDKQNEEIKISIGLLLPSNPEDDILSQSAMRGAELAIELANRQADGYSYELIVRTADGLWGAGSKASVDFVHDDKVIAIVTAVDGRNAHLVEQVASKSQVVQLSTRATEETLSQAYVPWFFRIVPNDWQQAEALIQEIYVNQRIESVYMLYEDDYDYSSAVKSFKKSIKKEGYRLAGQAIIPGNDKDLAAFDLQDNIEALVVFGSYQSARPILEHIRGRNASIKVFGSLNMTLDGTIGEGYSPGCEGGIFVSSKFCFTTAGQAFKDHFLKKYEQMPNPLSSYTFDGIQLIVQAVRKAGADREKIRDVLKEINYADAATGPIQFDTQGNRITPVFMIQMIKGHPVIMNP